MSNQENSGGGLSIASLVCGIIGMVLAFIPIIGFISWILCPLAIILGVIGKRQGGSTGNSAGGIVTGIIGLFICFAWASLFSAAMDDNNQALVDRPASVEQRIAQPEVVDITRPEPVPSEQIEMNELRVNSIDLARAYSQNEPAAQRQFGSSKLVVTGIVEGIDLDFMDDPVLRLNSENQFLPVTATFDKSYMDALAGIAKGQTVTVTCLEVGEVISAPILKQCTI